jgi:predicted ATP-grasp superfamily ATP-dependent carboligase
MLSPWPAPLLEPNRTILIAAASARAATVLARRAGYEPLVVDFFADADMCDAASAHLLARDGLDHGFSSDFLLPALETLAHGKTPLGLVYGAGFEDRPDLLEAIGARWRLLGNPAEVVRRVKDPMALASLCAQLGITHPQTRMSRPADCGNWLRKAIGGSGGTHVLPAEGASEHDPGAYYQRIAAGDPISVLFLGDGREAHIIGASRQWTAPARYEPFRFGGCLRPAGLGRRLDATLEAIVHALTRACGLVGSNSLDLLVDGETATLVEINPRPGATLDIYEDDRGSLFHAHVEACLGRLPKHEFRCDGAAAAAIAYVRHPIVSVPRLDWPEWTADRQRPTTSLAANDPLCTVKAQAADPAGARALVDVRAEIIQTLATVRKDIFS